MAPDLPENYGVGMVTVTVAPVEHAPAANAVGVNRWDPSASAVVAVHDQVPPLTTTEQIGVAPSDTSTVDPFTPDPLNVGVVSSTVAPSAGTVITGTNAAASMVTVTGVPATAAAGVKLYVPARIAVAGVQAHVPLLAVAVQTVVPSRDTVTVPLTPVPKNVGVVSLVMLPLAGAVIRGA